MSGDVVSDRRLLEVLTDELRRRILRRPLASALRAGRHVELVDAEAPTSERPAPQIAGGLGIAAIFWALGATLGDQLDASLGWWVFLTLGIVVAFVLLARIPHMGTVLALAAILAFPATFAVELSEHRYVWITHLVPAALVGTAAVVTRSVNVRSARDVGVAAAATARSAPLLAPLALVVLVVPALSADLWQAAVKLDTADLAALLVVTVVPLWLVVMRQLLSELPAVLETRSRGLAADVQRDELTRAMLRERLDGDAFELVDFTSAEQMRSAWPSRAEEYAPAIAAAEGDALRRPLQGRLAVCVIVVGLALTAYLYVVLAVIIDPSVAHTWSGQHVPTWRFELARVEIWFPGGIYLRVVGLLGALATATFLAFALLEERFSTALGDALLRLPADRLLALAVPYLALREERLASEDDALDRWNPGALTTEEPSPAVPAS